VSDGKCHHHRKTGEIDRRSLDYCSPLTVRAVIIVDSYREIFHRCCGRFIKCSNETGDVRVWNNHYHILRRWLIMSDCGRFAGRLQRINTLPQACNIRTPFRLGRITLTSSPHPYLNHNDRQLHLCGFSSFLLPLVIDNDTISPCLMEPFVIGLHGPS
jgi:hypothetical protein